MEGNTNSVDLLWLTLAWCGYFFLHSLFASLGIKQWVADYWPALMPSYRLLFNALAILLLVPPLWFLYSAPGPWLWRWDGVFEWISISLSVIAIVGFVWSLKYYDMNEFLGFRQYHEAVVIVEDQEKLQLSPLHRYIRHPWYFFALVLIWTRDMNLSMLLSALLMSAYFVIGSRLEERKLIRYHGPAYSRYMEKVPGLIPLPWKYLSASEAADLTSGTH